MAIFKSSTKGELEAKRKSEQARESSMPKNCPIPSAGLGGNVKAGKHHK